MSIINNPLFSKEHLLHINRIIKEASYILVYENNGLDCQTLAGKRLWNAKFIIATIADHIFDYFPYSYILNKDQKETYPSFASFFFISPDAFVNDINLKIADAFNTLDTIDFTTVKNKILGHFHLAKPKRNLDEEQEVYQFFDSVKSNLDEIAELLKQPKKQTDPLKPSREEIKFLMRAVVDLQDLFLHLAQKEGKTSDVEFLMALFSSLYTPLCFAWQGYLYGQFTDFGEDLVGFLEAFIFRMNPIEKTKVAIGILQKNSYLDIFLNQDNIKERLLTVLSHFLSCLENGSIVIT